MVHGLASQLGGGLLLSSRLGVGTVAELWLPVAEESADHSEAGAADSPVAATGTVLLVDDEELVRMSTATMLSDLGFRVLEAASGEEAMRMIREGVKADVLVTDHLMPGMTGTELARAVREMRPDVRVLIISGYAELDGVAPDLPRLTKPFNFAELAQHFAPEGQLAG
jgi:CheY-like chemotaxis protein